MGLFEKFKKEKNEIKTNTKTEKCFEDSLMEVQEGLIALCEELAEETPVDEIFIYGSIEDSAFSFNAFYLTQDKIITASKMSRDINMVKQFLKLGTDDLCKIAEICQEHNRPVPTELRLRYKTGSRSLDAHYEYDSVCNPENGLLPSDVFMSWKESVEN